MHRLLPAAAALILLGLLGSVPAAAQVGTSTLDSDKLAETMVVSIAGVQEDDIVFITGTVKDIELLEDIAVQARRVGAHPLIAIGSDRLERRMFVDVPSELDTQAPRLPLELAKIMDVHINVPTGDDPALLADIPPERFAARARAFEPVNEIMRERVVRYVELSNEMYPTDWRAERFGIPREELANLFWSAVQVDPTRLQTIGMAVESMLEKGKRLRITHPNGTDLQLSIEGRPAYVSDGVISEEDRKEGSAARSVWLPAGEVYITPVRGTAEGTVVVDRTFFQGQEISGLTMKFEGGKLTSMTATSGLERLKALYDAADEGKAEFAAIDIGINPNLKAPSEARLEAWTASGMVTVGIGNNTWAGGDNAVNFGWFGHLPGATVTVDGETLVERGNLEVGAGTAKS